MNKKNIFKIIALLSAGIISVNSFISAYGSEFSDGSIAFGENSNISEEDMVAEFSDNDDVEGLSGNADEELFSSGLMCDIEGETVPDSQGQLTASDTFVYVNPLYQDEITEKKLQKPVEQEQTISEDEELFQSSALEYCSTIEEAGAVLRQEMKKRSQTIEIYYESEQQVDYNGFVNIYNEAVKHTGAATEGDYLAYQCGGWTGDAVISISGDKILSKLIYTITYYSNAEQEAQVDLYVENVFKQMNLDGKSDYVKLKNIYSYVCRSVSYDYENVNNGDYTLKYSAYAALVQHSAVCQGYAVLLYRLLEEVGVDCRVIPGIAGGENHAWNIAKVDGKYYNLDATWDDVNVDHEYFLKGELDFEDHFRETSYASESFYAVYPMGEFTYSPDSTNEDAYEYTENMIVYTIRNNQAVVTGYTGQPETVTIPETVDGVVVTAIGSGAFAKCDSLKKIVFPSSVTEIEDGKIEFLYCEGAFYECRNLESVVIPSDSNLNYIGEWAFCGCSNLSEITLPCSVRELGLSAFQECYSLRELVLPEGLAYIQQNALSYTGLTQLYLPSTCQYFHSINHMESLDSITVSEENKIYRSIDGVLYGFDSGIWGYGWGLMLYPISKPDKEYTVWDDASFIVAADDFQYNQHLQKINIGKCSVIYSSNIRCDISVNDNNPDYSMINGLLCSKDKSVLVQIPSSMTGTVTIPDGITTIKAGAGYQGRFSAVRLPDGLRVIETGAFLFASELEEVIIPDSVTEIGAQAFQECPKLSKAVLPNNLKKLEWNTFFYCQNLEDVKIPDSVTEIEMGVFAGCNNLKHMVIPEGVTVIPENLFQYCLGLESIEIPDSVMIIGQNAFYGCSSLSDIYIPQNVTYIGLDVFGQCDILENVFFAGNAPSIGTGNILEGSTVVEDSRVFGENLSTVNIYYSKNNPTWTESAKEKFKAQHAVWNAVDVNKGVYAWESVYDINRISSNEFSRIKTDDYKAFFVFVNSNVLQIETAIVTRTDIEATCTNHGMTVFRASTNSQQLSGANDILEKEKMAAPAQGHTWDSGKVTVQPDCTQNGVKQYACTVCGETKTESIAAVGHKWNTAYTVDKNATCTVEGTKSIHCSICNQIKPESIVSITAIGHKWNTKYTVDKKATCTAKGQKSIHCSVCNQKKSGTVKTIAALGHKWNTKYTVDKKATCTAKGQKSIHCSVCNQKKSGTTKTIASLGHTWSTWKTTKSATYIQNGQQERNCTRCRKKETKILNKKVLKIAAVSSIKALSGNRIYLSWKNVTDATGYQVYCKKGTTGKWTKVATTSEISFYHNKRSKGATYYYKVRAYKKVSNTYVYGKFSAVKKIKSI